MELLSSFEWLEKPPMVEEIETIEEEELPEPQVSFNNKHFNDAYNDLQFRFGKILKKQLKDLEKVCIMEKYRQVID